MPISNANSNFPIVHINQRDDWDDLLDLCDGHLQEEELDKLVEMLDGCCGTVIVENNYVCKDYRDTYTNYYSKKFSDYPSKAIRLLFFRDAVNAESWWNVPAYANSFVGYSVIRPTRISSIGRTILSPKACNAVHGYLCLQKYEINFVGCSLEVEGFPFISQDTDVTVCAHAACWMCFRYFTERYSAYSEIYPYQITQLTTDLTAGRLLPSKGLTIQQVAEMFSRFGFYPRIYNRYEWEYEDADNEENQELDGEPTSGNETVKSSQFERLLYYYIESGIPLVLGIPNHAIAAIGHTSDLQREAPEGMTFSDNYVTSLIVNDDNHMPYQFLPFIGSEHLFAKHVSDFKISDVEDFVVPLYEKVYLAAEDVERLTKDLLESQEVGLLTYSNALTLDDIVIRIFLTSSRSYKKRRRELPLPHGLSEIYTQLPMPKFIWVAELFNAQPLSARPDSRRNHFRCHGLRRGFILLDSHSLS